MIEFIIKTRKGEEKPGHKYIRRVPLPAGGYKYIYHETQERHPKVQFVKRRVPKIIEVETLTPRAEAFSSKDRLVEDNAPNASMMATSDSYFDLSKSAREKAIRQGVSKLKSLVGFIREHGLTDRQKFREFIHTSNREVLSKYLGLTDHEFNSESGDKFDNYIKTSFSKDGHYVTFNYADNFFFNSINKEMPKERKPKWSLQMRVSRGITFDIETGDLVSLPYEKFFNMNEYIDGDLTNLQKKMSDQPFIASEKVDGILIQAFYDRHNDKIRIGTRAQLDLDDKGFIDTAEMLLKKSGNYMAIKNHLRNGTSMILELIDPRYRVVVGYGKKKALFLHGIRDLSDMSMVDFHETQDMAKQFGLETPNSKEFKNFEELYKFQKETKEDLEGYVLRFQDGSMIKAKTEAYFAKLKGLKALSHKVIGESILAGEDWNKFKYERIKSEELFDAADKYRADIMKQSDGLHKFMSGFVDKLLATTNWTSYGKDEKVAALSALDQAYHQAVRAGTINPEKTKLEDFRIPLNYLFSYVINKGDEDKGNYNKKLMGLTVNALKTGQWMGSKIQSEELTRSYVEMTLFKDTATAGASGFSGYAAAGLADVQPNMLYREMDKEEKDKREKQKMLED